MTRDYIIYTIHSHKPYLEKTFGFKNVFLFGSFASNHTTETSDIDLLVEADKSKKTYSNYLQAKEFLQTIFHRKIDLVYKESLHPLIQEEIQEDLIKIE